MTTLTWNQKTNGYEAEVEQGLLFVAGDEFAEIRRESNVRVAEIRHPEMGEEQIEELLRSEEGEQIDSETWNELIVAEGWLVDADIVDPDPDGIFSNVFIMRRKPGPERGA